MGDLRPQTSLMTSLICFSPSPGSNPGLILGMGPRPISMSHTESVSQWLGSPGEAECPALLLHGFEILLSFLPLQIASAPWGIFFGCALWAASIAGRKKEHMPTGPIIHGRRRRLRPLSSCLPGGSDDPLSSLEATLL